MTDLSAQLREILAGLAATDPACKRFGAFRHRYVPLAPLTSEELTAFEQRLGGPLPGACADYVDYLTRVSSGGVGPYHGLFPAAGAASHVLSPGKLLPHRALPLAHLGCGYFAVLMLDGPEAGQVWLHAYSVDVARPIFPTFTAFYLDWIERLAHNQWPEGFVEIGRCGLQGALSGYLMMCEQELGVAPGELAGAALRDALAGLGPGAIQIVAEGPLFAEGDTVDPCITCARMVENLVADGLAPDVVVPGVSPLPAR